LPACQRGGAAGRVGVHPLGLQQPGERREVVRSDQHAAGPGRSGGEPRLQGRHRPDARIGGLRQGRADGGAADGAPQLRGTPPPHRRAGAGAGREGAEEPRAGVAGPETGHRGGDPVSRAGGGSVRRHREVRGWLFVAPYLAYVATFFLFPMVWSLLLAWTDWNLISPVKQWVGLENFIKALQSPQVHAAFVNTYRLMAVFVPVAL